MPFDSYESCMRILQEAGKTNEEAKEICCRHRDAGEFAVKDGALPARRLCISLAIKPGDKGPDDSTWQEVCSVGSRFSPYLEEDPKPITTTPEMIDDFVRNFTADLPIDVEHARFEGSKHPEAVAARGWIKAIKRVGDRLMAAVQWVGEARDWVAEGRFKRISIEFGRGQDATTGKPIGWSLVGASLTNHPFWNVPDLALSVGTITRYGAQARGSESPQPHEYRSAPSPTNVATEETPMSDEMKALAKRLSIREDQVEAHVLTLAERATKAEASEAKIVTLTARISELEGAARASAKKDEDEAIALALKNGAIRNDEAEIGDARKVYALGRPTFDRLVMSRAVVRTEPIGTGAPDRSGPAPKPEDLDRETAGQKIRDLCLSYQVAHPGQSYVQAFSAVRRDAAHKAAFAAYEEE